MRRAAFLVALILLLRAADKQRQEREWWQGQAQDVMTRWRETLTLNEAILAGLAASEAENARLRDIIEHNTRMAVDPAKVRVAREN